MKLEQSFEVSAPLERVWEALIDVERVAPCLPGAAVTGRNEDGSYNGTFAVKIGPTSAAYTGKLRMENVDEAAHAATMDAQGSDKRGQGGAKATIKSSLTALPGGGTRVDVDTDYHITGRLARFGRGGMIEDISEKLLKQFAAGLQELVAGGDEPPAPEATAEPPASEVAAATEDAPAGEAAPAAAPEAAAAAPPPPAPTPTPAPRPPANDPEPLDAGSLVASVLWARIRSNPAPLAGAVVALLLLRRIRRRRG